MEDEIKALKAENTELKAKNKTLESDLTAANKKAVDAEAENVRLKGNFTGLEKKLFDANETIAKQKKELSGAEGIITDLKAEVTKAEKQSAASGYPIVKDKAGRSVEVLNAGFMFPKRGEITLAILEKDAELVSLLLDKNSDNVRLKSK